MSTSRPTKTVAHWRNIDYSKIKEVYVDEPQNSGAVRGSTVLYVIMALLVFPIGFFLIPLLLSTGKGNIRIGLFKAIHYLFVLPPLALAALLLVYPGLIAVAESGGIAVSLISGALYFFLMAAVGESSVRRHHSDIAAQVKPSSTKPPIWLVTHKIFGTPGDLSSASGKFKAENIEKGEDGEKRTAKLMEDLVRIPGTRIFHGVRWPGSKNADIDHIAVNGNKVALIDSKLWSGKSHAFTQKGHIVTYTNENKKYYRQVKFHTALLDLRESLRYRGVRNLDVHGWIAVHTGAGRKKAVIEKNSNTTRFLTLSSATDSIDEVGDWFAQGLTGAVRIKLMDDIAKRLK